MTRLREENADANPYPKRKGLRNFTWTDEAINDWEEVWNDLWRLGYKWEWQNSDRYARRYGDTFNRFAVHNDAIRLDMAVPLPGIEVLTEIREHLMADKRTDPRINYVIGAVDGWMKTHYPRQDKGPIRCVKE